MSAFLPVSVVLFALLLASSPALVIRNFQAASHNRFVGYPSNLTLNPSFIHSGLDLSGVGFLTPVGGSSVDTRRQFTLVSPRHFVAARHAPAPLGSTIRFVAADGSFVDRIYSKNYAIRNGAGQASDLLLGELSAAVDPASGVQFHSYLNLPTEASYVGEDLVVLGKSGRGGVGTIAAFADFSTTGINETRTMEFVYSTLFGGDDDAHLEVGDSGSPAFVVSGGRAAIVCTHTAAATAGFTRTGISASVPAYIDELNAEMEGLGYHMMEANPASVALAISQQLPTGVVRAGYPFVLGVTVQNQDAAEDANNLRLEQVLPVGAIASSVSASGWVEESGGEALLRGGLAAAASATVSMEVMFPEPGNFFSALTLDYDEGAGVMSSVPVSVIESYLSWSRDLVEAGAGDDPDGDGVVNLIEYSSGSEPDSGSTTRSPRTDYVAGGAEITYVRRTDAAERGLGYLVESSSTLEVGSWGGLGSELVSVETTPLEPGFETVVVTVAVGEQRRFFRLRVDLDE